MFLSLFTYVNFYMYFVYTGRNENLGTVATHGYSASIYLTRNKDSNSSKNVEVHLTKSSLTIFLEHIFFDTSRSLSRPISV
jgi:hypothetical protein